MGRSFGAENVNKVLHIHHCFRVMMFLHHCRFYYCDFYKMETFHFNIT
jgi:hypothetical protein